MDLLSFLCEVPILNVLYILLTLWRSFWISLNFKEAVFQNTASRIEMGKQKRIHRFNILNFSYETIRLSPASSGNIGKNH